AAASQLARGGARRGGGSPRCRSTAPARTPRRADRAPGGHGPRAGAHRRVAAPRELAAARWRGRLMHVLTVAGPASLVRARALGDSLRRHEPSWTHEILLLGRTESVDAKRPSVRSVCEALDL